MQHEVDAFASCHGKKPSMMSPSIQAVDLPQMLPDRRAVVIEVSAMPGDEVVEADYVLDSVQGVPRQGASR